MGLWCVTKDGDFKKRQCEGVGSGEGSPGVSPNLFLRFTLEVHTGVDAKDSAKSYSEPAGEVNHFVDIQQKVLNGAFWNGM